MNTLKSNLKLILASLWLAFTVSLTGWWLIFGLHQADELSQVGDALLSQKVVREQKMLLWEGGILILSLFAGGGSLFYYMLRERKQGRRMKEFFATFSHDLKTSLTSLRLQGESLQEDFKDRPSPLLNRLLNDTVRLQIQLENSLALANIDEARFFFEKIDLGENIETLRHHWPEANIRLLDGGQVTADARAFESVLKNVIQNAISHGGAERIDVNLHSLEAGGCTITVKDNGRGFSGETGKLGELFTRHTPTSGSGVGLYIVKELMRKMNGSVEFNKQPDGFEVVLSFREGTPA